MNLMKNLKYVYNKKGQIELLFDNILEHLRSIANKDLIVLCKDCHYKFHDKL